MDLGSHRTSFFVVVHLFNVITLKKFKTFSAFTLNFIGGQDWLIKASRA